MKFLWTNSLGHDLPVNVWGGSHEHDILVMQGGSVLGWGVVRAVQELSVVEYTFCTPSALILSPCRHMFRCWPEESPAHWGGSDDPTEGGRAGGGMAGGGLPLNFQHRLVQDGMSSFSPSCSYPPCWRQPSPQLKSSSDTFGGQNDSCKMRHISVYIILPQYSYRTAVFRGIYSLYYPLNFHNWNWCWGQV